MVSHTSLPQFQWWWHLPTCIFLLSGMTAQPLPKNDEWINNKLQQWPTFFLFTILSQRRRVYREALKTSFLIGPMNLFLKSTSNGSTIVLARGLPFILQRVSKCRGRHLTKLTPNEPPLRPEKPSEKGCQQIKTPGKPKLTNSRHFLANEPWSEGSGSAKKKKVSVTSSEKTARWGGPRVTLALSSVADSTSV